MPQRTPRRTTKAEPEQRESAPVLRELREDPVRFVSEVLGETGAPYPKQAEVLAACASSRRVSVVGCNGSGKDWAAARAVLGPTGVLLPFGDPHHGGPGASSFISMGVEAGTFTWTVPPAAMDAPYDAGDDACFQGLAPVLTFNGVDERATLPDSSAWSTGTGSADAPFSVGAWVNPIKVVSWYLLSKGPASSANQEWRFGNPEGVGRYGLYLVDASANAACHRLANVAFDAGRWAFVTATYDGTGGASAANGIRVYVDGADVSDTPVNNASYVAMENTVHGVVLGARWTSGSSYDRFLEGGLAGGPLGPFFTKKALSPAEVRALYGLGRASMGL
jgi:hypothetical protein